jgi:hypothetical protein
MLGMYKLDKIYIDSMGWYMGQGNFIEYWWLIVNMK